MRSNNRDESRLLTVGELARKSGVTVRTLQYYDKIGLLIPSEYSEGGRRMYSRGDILRLHQILFLKSLGFSLKEIRDRLLPTESTAELKKVLTHHKEVLLAQITQIQEAVNLIEKVIEEIRSGSEIAIERLFVIMEATRRGNPYSFMLRYFSKDQMEYFLNRFENNEDIVVDFEKKLRELTAELIELYQQNEEPEGSAGQNLASKWWDLLMVLTEGDPDLIRNIFALGADENNWPSDIQNLKEAMMSFLGRALSAYLKNNDIKLPFWREDKDV
jgi:DNA-binding transcriptional MerR regulator